MNLDRPSFSSWRHHTKFASYPQNQFLTFSFYLSTWAEAAAAVENIFLTSLRNEIHAFNHDLNFFSRNGGRGVVRLFEFLLFFVVTFGVWPLFCTRR
ncbi:hypothetical protein VTJ04DRAFT_9772 [Mycothermus thermophilus]|uniref:uncharacterized protein n=1 Tax=Humicola insolens TaxID=85995 RepID=UPI0037423617